MVLNAIPTSSIVDYVIMGIALGALLWGAWKGLVAQIFSILGMILACIGAYYFTPAVAQWASGLIGDSISFTAVKIICFVLIFVIISILCQLLARVAEKTVKITMLGWLNRLLGAVFCFIKILLLLAIVATILNQAGDTLQLPDIKQLNQSKAYSALLNFAEKFMPFVKELFSSIKGAE